MKDVIELAREAGFDCSDSGMYHPDTYDETSLDTYLERFAVLVRADEREACWRLCDTLWMEDKDAHDCREAIRARGQS